MKWFKDGDQLVLVRNDFENLQESDALFFPYDSEEAVILRRTIPETPEETGIDLTGNDMRKIKDILKNNKDVQCIRIIKEIDKNNNLVTRTEFSQLNILSIEVSKDKVKITKKI